MSGAQSEDLLSFQNAQVAIKKLKPSTPEELFEAWSIQQRSEIQKINVQAHHNVATGHEEFIVELLLSERKFPILVYDLLLTELWKAKVLPQIKSEAIKSPLGMLNTCLLIFHEGIIINLFELTFFHKEAVFASGDGLLELIDYSFRKISWLSTCTPTIKYAENVSAEQELENKIHRSDFATAISTLSVLRFVTENASELPVSVLTRLLESNDIITALVGLLLNPPWISKQGGKIYHFQGNKWNILPPSDFLKINQIAAQIWLTLCNLLLDSKSRNKYQFNATNKAFVLKLKSLLNETVIDQIPPLEHLAKFLDHLSIMDPPQSRSGLIIEQLPEIRDSLLKTNWQAVLEANKKKINSNSEEIKKFAEVFQSQGVENQLVGKPKCVNCGKEEVKRCSRCKSEWFCGRECQVKNWPLHKPKCDLIAK